jgi:peptidoglycan/LPS O-acetylase OafA/YrhL
MQIPYRREIDGLRAIAVLAVIFFHAGFPFFSGGFVGVDVFFVISGYLITSIILADMRAGTFSLLGFYERRARRILPALFVVLAATVALAPLFFMPGEIEDLSESLVHVVLFISNVYFYSHTGYFDTAAELEPLIHTWSLAVEEQFYIFFPFLLLTLWNRRKALVLPVLLTVTILSLAYSQFSTSSNAYAAFFLTPSRIWELLIGALAASHGDRVRLSANGAQWGSLAGAVLILCGVVLFDDTTPFPGLHALAPVLGTALVVLYASPATWVGRMLACRALVGIGLISYSAYLWHQPLFAFARHQSIAEPSVAVFAGLIVATLCFAYFSWRFVEQPFRTRSRISRRTVFAFAGTGTAVFAAVGLVGDQSDGFSRLYRATLNPRELAIWEDGAQAATRDPSECHQKHGNVSTAFADRFTDCFRKYGKGLIVLGDSHGADMFNAIKATAGRPFVFGVAHGGCRPHTPDKNCPFDDFRDFLSKHGDAVEAVIYTQAGFYLVQDSRGVPGNRDFFKLRSVPVYEPNAAFVDRVVHYLRSLTPYARVVWVGPRIEPHLNALKLKTLAMTCTLSRIEVPDNTERTFKKLDDFIRRRVAGATRITYVSTIDAVAFDEGRDLYDCNSVYWSDGDHWTTAGEVRFGKRISAVLAARGLL